MKWKCLTPVKNVTGVKKFVANQGYNVEIKLAVNSSITQEDSKCLKDCKRCASQKDLTTEQCPEQGGCFITI